MGLGVLDELLSLDVVHAVDTGDTVTVVSSSADCVSCNSRDGALMRCSVPDGEDTTGLGEGVLLLDATDALLQDGGDLGGGGLSIGSVGAGGGERRGAGLWWEKSSVW